MWTDTAKQIFEYEMRIDETCSGHAGVQTTAAGEGNMVVTRLDSAWFFADWVKRLGMRPHWWRSSTDAYAAGS